jgi:hypothetical protein
MARECSKCGEVKELSDFPTYNNKGKKGIRKTCHKCRYAIAKLKGYASSGHKTSRQQRKHEIKYRYGITEEELTAMYEAQEGRCSICKTHEDETGTLNIDHCHTTGKVRGLLCKPCNMGLGYFKDDNSRLIAAAKYLETVSCA